MNGSGFRLRFSTVFTALATTPPPPPPPNRRRALSHLQTLIFGAYTAVSEPWRSSTRDHHSMDLSVSNCCVGKLRAIRRPANPRPTPVAAGRAGPSNLKDFDPAVSAPWQTNPGGYSACRHPTAAASASPVALPKTVGDRQASRCRHRCASSRWPPKAVAPAPAPSRFMADAVPSIRKGNPGPKKKRRPVGPYPT